MNGGNQVLALNDGTVPLFGPTDLSPSFAMWMSQPASSSVAFSYHIHRSFSIWSTDGAGPIHSSIALSIPEYGNLPLAGKAPLVFQANLSCADAFVGLVTWEILTTDNATGDISLNEIKFLWRCAVPGCPANCGSTPGGACNYHEGRCDCAANWYDDSCSTYIEIGHGSELCPGDTFDIQVKMPSPVTYQEWAIVRNDEGYVMTWLYLTTLGHTSGDSSLNLTEVNVTFPVSNFYKPDAYHVAVHMDDLNILLAKAYFRVKTWEECGITKQSGGLSDCSSADRGTLENATTGQCSCSPTTYWLDCSRGCSPANLWTAQTGYIVSDPAALLGADMHYTTSAECNWHILPDAGDWDQIEVTFEFMDIDDSDILVLSVDDNSTGILSFTGTDVPAPVTVTAPGLTLALIFDYSDSGKGFIVSYKTVKLPMSAGQIAAIAVPVSVASCVALALVIVAGLMTAKRIKKMEDDKANAPELPWTVEEEEVAMRFCIADSAKALASAGVHLSKAALTFGIAERDPCPVLKHIQDSLTIQNLSSAPIRYKILINQYNGWRVCTAKPGNGIIERNRAAVVNFEFVLECTTSIRTRFKFVAEKLNGQSMGATYIEVNLQGQLSTHLDPDEIQTSASLGSGAFGDVFSGVYRARAVAVKVLRKQQLLTDEEMADFSHEIGLYERLRCPHIVDFVGASHVPRMLCLVTELMPKGSLEKLINKMVMPIPFLLQLQYATDIAKAMEFLHTNNVIYRDLKPSNCLIASIDTHAPLALKLSDFGTSKNVDDCRALHSYPTNGTTVFMAPEMLSGQMYNNKVDVYSFALTLHNMYTRKRPWTGFTYWEVTKAISAGKRPGMPEDIFPPYADLINNCWHADFEKRPEFSDIVLELAKMKALATLPKGWKISKKAKKQLEDATADTKGNDAGAGADTGTESGTPTPFTGRTVAKVLLDDSTSGSLRSASVKSLTQSPAAIITIATAPATPAPRTSSKHNLTTADTIINKVK